MEKRELLVLVPFSKPFIHIPLSTHLHYQTSSGVEVVFFPSAVGLGGLGFGGLPSQVLVV